MNPGKTGLLCVMLGAASLLAAGPALGDGPGEPALVPLPSVLDFTRGDGFGVALGAGVEYESAYDGADEHELEVEPAGAVHYRNGDHLFFWEGFELGWRGRLADHWLVQAGARYEDGLEPDDSDDGNLDGIEPRDSHVVGFLEVRRGLGQDWRNWVAVAQACVELYSSDIGDSPIARQDYEYELGLSLVWHF